MTRKFEATAECRDKRGIPVGFGAPQPVVAMDDGQRKIPGRCELVQNGEQCNRVWPPGHGHKDLLPRLQEPPRTNSPGDLLMKRVMEI